MTLRDYLLATYPDLGWFQRDQAFAERIGTSRQNISRYRQFKRFPSPVNIAVIRNATRGAVTAEDHLPPTLRETPRQRARRLQEQVA